MEPTFNRYIWKHTSRQQLWVMSIVLISMIPFYFAFELPKKLINGPIQGQGFEEATATQAFFPEIFQADIQLDRIETLIGLSFMFLFLVIINGLFKYYINTYKGILGERLLRRIRYELIDRILRFLPGEFRRIKGGEISSMVKDEVEPFGGFTAEAYVQPLLLGGQSITALGFIFVQNFWLGMLALLMASLQMIFIPRLRKRLLILGRERQIAARQLAGRVTEVVDGIEAVHAYDTSNYERADIASRLAKLFRIRFEIFSQKYKIKFLNNLLSQMTPFLFYLVGGFFAITGRLDVGQLVAVIAAYKELPGPLKALIDWDLAKQDVEVKYDQILEQFDVDELIDPDSQAIRPSNEPALLPHITANNVTTENANGATTLEDISLSVAKGETLAIVGDANSGAYALAEVFGRAARPVQGKLMAGEHSMFDLPESVTGRQIAYVSADTCLFYGTLEENLLYGLKHYPLNEVKYKGANASRRRWELREAKLTANPVLDLKSEWIDENHVIGLTGQNSLVDAMRRVLEVVNLSDDVVDFALHSNVPAESDPELIDQIVSLRESIQRELASLGMDGLVIPFEMDSYNGQATVLENLLFGILIDTDESDRPPAVTNFLVSTMSETGLDVRFVEMGLKIADIFIEIFQDLPEDHHHFDQFDLFDTAQTPQFRKIFNRCSSMQFAEMSADDRLVWINLFFKYAEPEYRFGLLDDDLMTKIVSTRKLLHEKMPDGLRADIDMYDQQSLLSSANLLDNIVFGKVNRTIKNAEGKLRDIVVPLLNTQKELFNKIFSIGLNYTVGPSGRKLSPVQRQKLNMARVLMRKSDYYIFNRPLSGLDHIQQGEIIEETFKLFESEELTPGVVWALAAKSNATHFQRKVSFNGKTMSEDEKVSLDGKALPEEGTD